MQAKKRVQRKVSGKPKPGRFLACSTFTNRLLDPDVFGNNFSGGDCNKPLGDGSARSRVWDARVSRFSLELEELKGVGVLVHLSAYERATSRLGGPEHWSSASLTIQPLFCPPAEFYLDTKGLKSANDLIQVAKTEVRGILGL